MIFCKECGGALNLFETHDEEVCYSCLRKRITPRKPVPAEEKLVNTDLLADSVLSYEDQKFVVRSPEGWVLWSAPDNETHTLATILSRAKRIAEIRRKRQK